MSNRETIKDILVNLVLFLLLLTFLVSIHLIINSELPWLYLLLVFPFFSLLLVRKKVYVLPTFFIIHGIFLALPIIILNNPTEIIPITIVTLLSVVYSIRVRAKKEWRPYTRQAVLITISLAVMFFIVTVMFGAGVEDVDRFFFAVTFIAIAAMLLVIHMDNVDSRIETLPTRLKNTTPIRNILFANNTLISGFLAFMMVFGMLSLFAPSLWRVARLGAFALMHGLRVLLMLAFAPFLAVREIEPAPEGYAEEWMPFRLNFANDEIFDVMAGQAAGDDVAFEPEAVSTIFFIMAFILITILVIGLIFALRAAIRALIKNFFNKKGGDESESLMPDDAKGKLAFLLKDIANFLPRFRSDAKHPIRKAFSKKVNSHIKKGVRIRACDTHDVIAGKIRKTENIDELAIQYEKVRYGQ